MAQSTARSQEHVSADPPQGDLEMPCKLTSKGNHKDVKKFMDPPASSSTATNTTDTEQARKKRKCEPDIISVEDVIDR